MSQFTLTLDPSSARVTASLNGQWEIAGGDAHHALEPFSRTIEVPSLVDCAEPPYEWSTHEYHWYRTTFTMMGEGDVRSLFLKLHQSMFGTAMWVNGQYAGGSISCYTSQTYKIDEYCEDGAPNEILIRIGSRQTLPPESAVGRDQEKEVYAPGIWGDVELFACGEVRVTSVQTIPHCRRSVAEVRVTIENFSSSSRHITAAAVVHEKASKRPASDLIPKQIALSAYGVERVTFQIPIEMLKMWSPDSPFLYTVTVHVQESSILHDEVTAAFGMREFRIAGADFFLNGKKILLRGSNIALHRFFSDRMRRRLPWDEAWVKKILVEIPKAHHFNFFRNHIGPLYHRWYDIADEHGIMLQNEWQFWCSTGTKAQIVKEFTEWITDGCNHPSIVMWDPLNESSDDVIRHEVVPMMKKLDPTRPWESVDCFEQHPYIYSLGMVLNARPFGFTRSIDEIEHMSTPSMVNEFLWWWLNSENMPTSLMQGVVERWLGRSASSEDVIAHQSFMAQELVELFRRMQVRAIQPFVYLSNNDGPTGNWFEGDIALGRVKPVMAALKNAFAPFGVSIELWDRHFTSGDQKQVRIFVFNDTMIEQRGTLRVSVESPNARAGMPHADDFETIHVHVPPVDTAVVTVNVEMPNLAGTYALRAQLIPEGDSTFFAGSAHAQKKEDGFAAVSEKILHVFDPVKLPDPVVAAQCAVMDPSGEIPQYLGLQKTDFAIDRSTRVVLTHGNVVLHQAYQSRLDEISGFVRTGGTLIVIEPEFRVVGSASAPLVNDVELGIRRRADLDKGGYDSYVFAEDESHPLWKGLTKEHLKMFNGGYGGEVVSEYELTPSVHARTHAVCGLGLSVKAMFEIPYAKGRILVSRLQCRGRLVPSVMEGDALFARRSDPVMQQLLVNMIEYALS